MNWFLTLFTCYFRPVFCTANHFFHVKMYHTCKMIIMHYLFTAYCQPYAIAMPYIQINYVNPLTALWWPIETQMYSSFHCLQKYFWSKAQNILLENSPQSWMMNKVASLWKQGDVLCVMCKVSRLQRRLLLSLLITINRKKRNVGTTG